MRQNRAEHNTTSLLILTVPRKVRCSSTVRKRYKTGSWGHTATVARTASMSIRRSWPYKMAVPDDAGTKPTQETYDIRS